MTLAVPSVTPPAPPRRRRKNLDPWDPSRLADHIGARCHLWPEPWDPAAPARTIVTDPPWDYERDLGWGGWNGVERFQVHPRYTLQTVDEIKAMAPAVNAWADPAGCALFMWTTFCMVRQTYDILDAWGWGTPDPENPYNPAGGRVVGFLPWPKSVKGAGPGRWHRQDAEFVIHAIRGDIHPPDQAESSVIIGRRGGHSDKPHAFYDRVMRISPGPYLDMYSRSPRMVLSDSTDQPAWYIWGDGKR